MTELTITPKVADKTARFKGTVAAGEHVAVTIKGGAEWIGEDDGANLTLRLIDLTTKRTLAVFPRPAETLEENEEPDAWGSSGGDLTCTLNLNTLRMVNAARHMLRVPVMFVLGDTDAPRTLYFKDIYEVEYWPERIGDDVPYDLDAWPKKIDEWTELVDEWTEQMAAFRETLSGHVENVGIHVTAEQKVAWTTKQNAISDLDTIRAGAAKGATAIQEHQDISGKADLVNGKVPQSQLPSYVDDVLEYASLSAFPKTGEEGKIYVAKDTNRTYRWSGTQYVQVGGSDITVDSAFSENSTNPVQNKVVAVAVNARPTKADVEAGWWSAWTFSGASPQSGRHWEVNYSQEGLQWNLFGLPDGTTIDDYADEQLPEFYYDSTDIGYSLDAPSLYFSGLQVTATRHRVAAPIPTKTSELANDSGFLTAHQQLTSVTIGNTVVGYTLGMQTPKLGMMDDVRFAPVYSPSGPYDVGQLCVKDGQLYKCISAIPSGNTPWNHESWVITDVDFELAQKYKKPSGGIPKTDMAGAVQASLGLADTAVQPSLIADKMPMYPMDEVTALQPSDWTSDWPTDDQFVVDGVEWNDTNKTWDVTFRDTEDPSYTQIVSTTPNAYTVDALTFTIQNQGDVIFERSRVLTVNPYTVATYTADSTASSFTVAVGNLPAGVTGVARDAVLVIDCTALTGSNDTAPTVKWPINFHPRTDRETDLAIVEAGKRAVFYISEFAAGEFAVGGWQETEGGYDPNAQSEGSGT